jgi:hypothetical protein
MVVPFVSLAMLSSFIAVLAGMVVPFLAPIISLQAVWILTYMQDIATLLSRIPHASIQIKYRFLLQ